MLVMINANNRERTEASERVVDMVALCLWEANNSTRRNRPRRNRPRRPPPPVLPAVVNDLAAFAVLTVFAATGQGRSATIITATRRLTISPRWRRPTAVGTTTGNETRQTADQAPCPSGVAARERGLEPLLTGPEPVVLPITPLPKGRPSAHGAQAPGAVLKYTYDDNHHHPPNRRSAGPSHQKRRCARQVDARRSQHHG